MRSFTDWLRSLDADRLGRLLESRPDLCQPAPRDIADLAARASTDASIAHALDELNAWLRSVCVAAAGLDDPIDPATVGWLVDGDPAEVTKALSELAARGLVWGSGDPATGGVQLVRGVRSQFGRYPGGLAPVSSRPLPLEQIETAWNELGEAEHAIVDRLVWGQPTGAVRDADRRGAGDTPIDRLLSAGLLKVLDRDRVILPREVSLFRRRPHRIGRSGAGKRAPAIAVSGSAERPVDIVDRAAIGAAFELTADVEQLAESLATSPRKLLRDGSLAQRDLNALARALGMETERTAWVLELAATCRLVSASFKGSTSANQSLLPTTGYDRWLDLPAANRWAELVQAWFTSPRWFSHFEVRALSPEAEWRSTPRLRSVFAQVLSTEAPGTGVDTDLLAAALAWHRPAWAHPHSPLPERATDLWHDARQLGLVGLGCITSAGGDWSLPTLVATLGPLFPGPVHEIVIQSDLTAVAAGPLAPHLAAELRMLADTESRGAAGVFRFSAGSLRRAFDAGWSMEQVSGWLTEHSVTGVPQPLSYLVGDVGRRFGSIRVGAAASYVRVPDEAHAAAILQHPRAAALGLRRLGVGLLIAEADPDEVVALLRAMELSPAAENSDGGVVLAPVTPRAPMPEHQPTTSPPDPRTTAQAVLRTETRRAPLTNNTDDVLEVLQNAHRTSARVTVSYVAEDGTTRIRSVVPISLSAGQVRLTDREGSFTLALSRISSVGVPPETPTAHAVPGG
ncbi:MAG: helicase-associated domain-containing protein [Propionibacteriaceae bacterium]